MSQKISDISVVNTAPAQDRKIELESPTGPTSEQATLANVFKVGNASFNHSHFGGL